MSNFTKKKIRLVGAEVSHADRQSDRQTDMNFANAPKSDCPLPCYIALLSVQTNSTTAVQ